MGLRTDLRHFEQALANIFNRCENDQDREKASRALTAILESRLTLVGLYTVWPNSHEREIVENKVLADYGAPRPDTKTKVSEWAPDVMRTDIDPLDGIDQS